MSLQQNGPSASAYIDTINDVGGAQYNFTGNDVFQSTVFNGKDLRS